MLMTLVSMDQIWLETMVLLYFLKPFISALLSMTAVLRRYMDIFISTFISMSLYVVLVLKLFIAKLILLVPQTRCKALGLVKICNFTANEFIAHEMCWIDRARKKGFILTNRRPFTRVTGL